MKNVPAALDHCASALTSSSQDPCPTSRLSYVLLAREVGLEIDGDAARPFSDSSESAARRETSDIPIASIPSHPRRAELLNQKALVCMPKCMRLRLVFGRYSTTDDLSHDLIIRCR